MSRVLVAGIGNIFCSDDGFGVEVVGRLAGLDLPPGVVVEDFGIRGIHLAYELLDSYDTVILVDAFPHGEVPGTVTVLEPDLESLPGVAMDAHTMSPGTVLATLRELGGEVDKLLLVGCEPATVEEGIGLSVPVMEAIEPAVAAVAELARQSSSNPGSTSELTSQGKVS